MRFRKNNFAIGLTTGIIMPPVAFYIFCIITFPGEKPMELLAGYHQRNVLTHVISLAVLINLPVFFGFLGTNDDRTAKGVIGATFIYAFIVLFMKLS